MSHVKAEIEFDALHASVAATPIPQTYFETDCMHIVERAQATPDAFPGIAALVILSIRQPFYMLDRAMADVALRDYDSSFLWGWKPGGLRYVRANKSELHRSAVACRAGKITLDELILDYLAIPGLGIVKASFLAQMTVGDGACLDTHNLRSLGLNEAAFKLSKSLTVATVRKRISAYNAVWRSVGDSAHWWDSWCDSVASRGQNSIGAAIPHAFRNGAHVSHWHRLSVTAGVH